MSPKRYTDRQSVCLSVCLSDIHTTQTDKHDQMNYDAAFRDGKVSDKS